MPASIGLGDTSEFSYTLRSDWPWPTNVELFDVLPSGLSADATLERVALAGRETKTIALPITGMTRGNEILGDVALRSTTPLGLVARISRPRSHVATVGVVPSLTNVRRFRLLAIQHRLSDAGIRALKQRGEGTALAGLRDSHDRWVRLPITKQDLTAIAAALGSARGMAQCRAAIDFGVYGAPESFLVDAGGVIRYKHIGPFTAEVIATELAPAIAALRREAP